MKKLITVLNALVLGTIVLLMSTMPVYAVSWDGITGWLSGTALAFILTGLLAIGVIAKYTNWISNILIAFGFLCVSVGNSTSDGKITKEELQEFKVKWNALRASAKNKPK